MTCLCFSAAISIRAGQLELLVVVITQTLLTRAHTVAVVTVTVAVAARVTCCPFTLGVCHGSGHRGTPQAWPSREVTTETERRRERERERERERRTETKEMGTGAVLLHILRGEREKRLMGKSE